MPDAPRAAAAAAVPGLPDPGRCLVMGILNVTPDSFSDGGRWDDAGAAEGRGLALVDEGADLVDVGGESTRPGAARPSTDEEAARVVPVVRRLAAAGVVVTVDTMRSGVAAPALDAGAVAVNDVSGGLADPAMLALIAAAGVPCVLMHWRGHADRMQDLTAYGDVVPDVVAALRSRLDAAVAAGVDPERVVLDPGLGFAKTADHNWALLAGLPRLAALGRPVLVGASRKAFLGALLADPVTGEPRGTAGRETATAAVTALAAAAGAWGVRVHDARASRDAVEVAARWARG